MIPSVCSATDWEVEQVRNLIRNHGGSCYVEIGSHTGGSLAAYGGEMPARSLLLSVNRSMLATHQASLNAVAAHLRQRHDVALVTGDSHHEETCTQVWDELVSRRELIDVLLIDGDHRPQACAQDIDVYGGMVRPGGLILMHDCGGPNPAKAMTEEVANVVAGLHSVWLERSQGHRRVMIQEWCGYGGWYV